MNYYKNDIKHCKGDTYSSAIVIEGLGQTVDSIYFTCRENLNDNAEILFQSGINDGISMVEYDEEKDIRKYAVRVSPSKTRELQSGTYYYDLEVSVNSDVFTVMKGKFILEQDATREDAEPEEPLIILVINSLNEINGETIGGDVLYELDYLNETKELIKEGLNDLGIGITDTDTFRDYVDFINSIYTKYPKTSAEGTSISLNTNAGKMILNLKSNDITQEGTPTPESSINVNTITGDNTITIENSNSTGNQNYSINLNGLEYCKLGSSEDKIYRDDNGDWYFEEHVGKKILNGTENWVYSTLSNDTITSAFVRGLGGKNLSTYMCDKFPYLTVISVYTTVEYCGTNGDAMRLGVFNSRLNTTDLQGLKSWLSQNNIKVYFELATPITTQITDTTLVSQLENLYQNAMSYQGTTIISQTNDNLPFILNATALMKGDE